MLEGDLRITPASGRAETPSRNFTLLARSADLSVDLVLFSLDARGHPLVVRGDLLLEIPGLDPEIGLRQLRLRHPDRTLEVEVADPGVVLDVDTPIDYERLRI